MRKISLKDVARAAFWLQFNMDSKCPFCQEKVERDKKGILALRHLRLEHPDIAYTQETI